MSWGEEQQKEIETIRERKIIVKLSDADCDRLARKCGEHGLTIGELLKSVSINEDVFKHEFKVALNDFLKLNT